MRLAVSFFILVVTGLNFAFGQPDAELLLTGMIAGMLLALTVVVDHLLPMNSKHPEPADHARTSHAEPKRSGS